MPFLNGRIESGKWAIIFKRDYFDVLSLLSRFTGREFRFIVFALHANGQVMHHQRSPSFAEIL